MHRIGQTCLVAWHVSIYTGLTPPYQTINHQPSTHKQTNQPTTQNATLAAATNAGAQTTEAIAAAVNAAAATNLSTLADFPGFALPGSESDFSYIPTPADIVAGVAAGGVATCVAVVCGWRVDKWMGGRFFFKVGQ